MHTYLLTAIGKTCHFHEVHLFAIQLQKGTELNNKRAKWLPKDWAKQHGLGDPLASVFFTSSAGV